ncbi:hypothetical protein E2C01_075371 [Portunus trituberculatus]|uniref:Uncharacterized protein n=1 Tax=Portunus trituberculatus TaxID=210409 RepID=A0A5B7IFZ1_PORTR|nr:hypothetical protein [Portunus trituberculatus]
MDPSGTSEKQHKQHRQAALQAPGWPLRTIANDVVIFIPSNPIPDYHPRHCWVNPLRLPDPPPQPAPVIVPHTS